MPVAWRLAGILAIGMGVVCGFGKSQAPPSPLSSSLKARVVAERLSLGEEVRIWVELTNEGAVVATVPALGMRMTGSGSGWRLEVFGKGVWAEVPWKAELWPPDSAVRIDGPAVEVRPGERALVCVVGSVEAIGTRGLKGGGEFRLVSAGAWGYAVTPDTRFARSRGEGKGGGSAATRESKPPVPEHFPELNPHAEYWPNGSGMETKFSGLDLANWDFFEALSAYDEASVRTALENRLNRQTNFSLRLVLAVELAQRGSEKGRQALLEAMGETNVQYYREWMEGLEKLGRMETSPEWVCRAMLGAVRDRRGVMETPLRVEEEEPTHLISEETGELIDSLGRKKYRPAVPDLMALAQNSDSSLQGSAIEALGEIGDRSAIDLVWQLVKAGRGSIKIESGTLGPDSYREGLRALVALGADGIEDELLTNIVHPDVIELLVKLKSDRGAAALRKIVGERRVKEVQGSNPETDRRTIERARLALVELQESDRVEGYGRLLRDASISGELRYEIIQKLEDEVEKGPGMGDRRIVPLLLQAAADNKGGFTSSAAIWCLSHFREARVIDGLIRLFSVKFVRPRVSKDAPDAIYVDIGDALEEITGQSFGSDGDAWRSWWATADRSRFK